MTEITARRRLGLLVEAVFDEIGGRVALIASHCGVATTAESFRRRFTESGHGGRTTRRESRQLPLISVLKLCAALGTPEARGPVLLAELGVAPDGSRDPPPDRVVAAAWRAAEPEVA